MTMTPPSVAIITRTKNRNILLQRAVKSILSQTIPDWTHVVVNDGGDPAALDAALAPHARAYGRRLTVIHNPTSLGMEAASNVGLRATASRYVVIHDDDDSWQPRFLEKCVAYLDNPPPTLGAPVRGVVAHSRRVLEEFDGKTVTLVGEDSFNSWMKGVSLYRLASSNCFPPISFVFARDALEAIGPFREDLPVLGDWEFHLRFAYHFEIGLIREELANYHHRLDLKDSVYGNTVIAGDDKHQRYNYMLRNELLRQDLRDGKPGLGFLVNFANSFEIMHGQMAEVVTAQGVIHKQICNITDNEFPHLHHHLEVIKNKGWFRNLRLRLTASPLAARLARYGWVQRLRGLLAGERT